MAHVLTVTMNPSIDISSEVDRVIPSRKLRCGPARRDPGGGGVNVARVVERLGHKATALFPAGGEVGRQLRTLVEKEGITALAIAIDGQTREDFTVVEHASGEEYRFVAMGPALHEWEWRACLDAIETLPGPIDYIVASGSLPPGAPEDFYARVAALARGRGAPIVVDTSGPALKAALAHGVDLFKPSLREMRELTGRELSDPASLVAIARDFVDSGQARIVALTLGSQGAILATAGGAWRAWPLPIKAVSTVGAGDSFLGAMVCALAGAADPTEAFRHGVAAGSAALLAPGTQLCQPHDIAELLPHVHIDRAL
jgi:6-phosphofructokinase 2